MSVNETVAVEKNDQQQKGSFGAKVKEYFRKKIVNLKRKPQNIPLIFMLASTVYFMLILFVLSKAINVCSENPNVTSGGICVFIVTLLSLLSLVSFIYAFPKRKKPVIVMIVVVFVMIAAMIVCDVLYYTQIQAYLANLAANAEKTGQTVAELHADADYIAASSGQPYVIGHIVLLALSAVVFALLPIIKKLLNMIDTSIKLESATENMSGKIDLVD